MNLSFGLFVLFFVPALGSGVGTASASEITTATATEMATTMAMTTTATTAKKNDDHHSRDLIEDFSDYGKFYMVYVDAQTQKAIDTTEITKDKCFMAAKEGQYLNVKYVFDPSDLTTTTQDEESVLNYKDLMVDFEYNDKGVKYRREYHIPYYIGGDFMQNIREWLYNDDTTGQRHKIVAKVLRRDNSEQLTTQEITFFIKDTCDDHILGEETLGDCSSTCPSTNCEVNCCTGSAIEDDLSKIELCGNYVGPSWCNNQVLGESCCFTNDNDKPKPSDTQNSLNFMLLPQGCVDYCANYHDYCCHHRQEIIDPMFKLEWQGSGLNDDGSIGGDYGNCNIRILQCTQNCLNRNAADLTDTLVPSLGDTYSAVTNGFGENVCNILMANAVQNTFQNVYSTSCSSSSGVHEGYLLKYFEPLEYDDTFNRMYGTAESVHFRIWNDSDEAVTFISVDDKLYNHMVDPAEHSLWLIDAITDDYRSFKIDLGPETNQDITVHLKKTNYQITDYDGENLPYYFSCDIQEGEPLYIDANREEAYLEITADEGKTTIKDKEFLGGSCVLSVNQRAKLDNGDQSCRNNVMCKSNYCRHWAVYVTGTGYACEDP